MVSRLAPQNVGIIALDYYFPQQYVNQTELEKYDKAPAGKYTTGLGQTNMAFVGDREDIYSICLTVVKNLLEKFNINPSDVGRLEVGTETIIDKAKAVKTVLMDLFRESGNSNVDGVDTINACYGGTNALFNAVQWVESSYWDGRYAIVVAGDIAIYATGPARPTGGCGVCAMLVGPNAPLVLDTGLRGTHMENVYDFYKPNLDSEFPVVDGKLSADCYLRAVDSCYATYSEKFEKKLGNKMAVDAVDYIVFHAPYNKLVQKSLARLLYNDMLRDSNNSKFAPIAKYKELGLGEKSYSNVELEKSLAEFSKPVYHEKVHPTTLLPKNIGNSYCGALYAGLVALIAEVDDSLIGKRIIMFSYGSGLAASMFSITVNSSVKNIAQKIDLKVRLAKRSKIAPEQYVQTLEVREKMHHNLKDYTPSGVLDFAPGTFYLTKVDAKLRRSYARTPSATQARL